MTQRDARGLATAIAAHAARRPDDPAVICGEGTTSYAQLMARAARIAYRLAEEGVGPGDRVAVLVRPGREAIAAYLGCWLLGAAYVPVDPDQPAERRDLLVRISRVSATLAGAADAVAGAVTPADLGPWPAAGSRIVGDTSRSHAGTVAYIVHTSGSTGTPKAIEVEHGNLRHTISGFDAVAPADDGFIGSWWTSTGFDAAMWEVWAPLQRGGCVAVVPPPDRLEPGRLVSFFDRHGVGSAFVPPLLLPGVADELERDPRLCRHLERMLVGVEPLPLGLLQRIAGRGIAVANGYGPAEATVFCTLYRVPADGGDPHARTPIGTALPGGRVHLVAGDARVSRADESGEIVVSGPGVARGYLAQPGPPDAETRFASFDGEWSYRTGDWATLDEHGDLVFDGRHDRQLKLRGFRIEPGAVETVLRRAAGVDDVVVGARRAADGSAVLAAYVTSRGAVPVAAAELRAHAAQRLPRHEVPGVVLVLDTFPQTRHGKIDHAALATLPVPDEQPGGSLEPAAGADRWTVEAYAAWRDALPAASGDTSFVAAGGTSMDAARVAARLRTRCGRDVTALDVLLAGNADDLAARVRGAGVVRTPTAGGLRSARLDAQQEAIWFHDRLHDPEGVDGIYVEAVCFTLPDGVDHGALATAFDRAVVRHAAFGATVDESDDGPWLHLDRHRITLEHRTRPASSQPVGEGLAALTRGAVRLDTGPLMRALVVDDGRAAHLLLVWHHLVVDSWSVRLFLTDLSAAYATAAPLPPAPVTPTVCDVMAARAATTARPDDVAAEVARLLPAIASAPAPTAVDGPAVTTQLTVPPATLARLRDAAAGLDVTLAACLLRAGEQAAAAAFARPVVPILLAVDERMMAGSEQISGCLLDTAVHVGVRDRGAPGGAVRRCAAELAALRRPGRARWQPALPELRRRSGQRLPDFPPCLLGIDEVGDLPLGDTTARRVPLPRRRSPSALTVVAAVGEGSLDFDISAPSDFDAAAIARVTETLTAALDVIAGLAAPVGAP